MAGGLTDDEIVKMNPKFAELITLMSSKTPEKYRQELNAKIKDLNDNIEKIKIQIQENQNTMPESADWGSIEKQISELEEKKQLLFDSISDVNKQLELEKVKANNSLRELNTLKDKQSEIEKQISDTEKKFKSEIEENIKKLERERNKLIDDISDYQFKVKSSEKRVVENQNLIEKKKKEKEELIVEYNEIKAMECPEISNDSLVCPTCLQDLPEAKKDYILENHKAKFNQNKESKLSVNMSKGKALAEEISELEKFNPAPDHIDTLSLQERIDEIAKKIELEKGKIETLTVGVPEELEQIKIKISDHKPYVSEIKTDIFSQQEEIKSIQSNIDNLKYSLSKRDEIKNKNERILSLSTEMTKNNQDKVLLEKNLILLDEFNKIKITFTEEKVNKMFSKTTVQMFRSLMNGGEEEVCIMKYKGVPYSVLNQAGRINMGVDIINTFSRHYNLYLPLFIDNAESVTDWEVEPEHKSYYLKQVSNMIN